MLIAPSWSHNRHGRHRPARTPLTGEITVPGDKSISHRALMFGALAVGQTRITGLLEGEDVLRTAAAMRALGADVARDGAGPGWSPGAASAGSTEPADVLDMGNSGTAARLLCGILASHPISSVMTGDACLRSRPMAPRHRPAGSLRRASSPPREGGRLPLAIEGARDALPLDLPPAGRLRPGEIRDPAGRAERRAAITAVEEPEADARPYRKHAAAFRRRRQRRARRARPRHPR